MPNLSSEKPVIQPDLSHSMVHYLLTIHKLKEEKGYARVTDIAKDLQLTKGSVSTALTNLKKRGLVAEEEDSKFLLLTEDGHKEVHQILSARTLLYYFLKDFVGVSPETAEKDACLMEHLLSRETGHKFFDFLKKLACSCEEMEKANVPSSLRFDLSLDLCEFKDSISFFESQKGDRHLPADKN
ncbi:MAG: metal-dependent transcriptional regulator [Bacteriovoracaceae bacterium]